MNKLLTIIAIISIAFLPINAMSGSDVACGEAGFGSTPPPNCNGCGATQTIQNLFQHSTGAKCQVKDCTADPGANLNGWMCRSCSTLLNTFAVYGQGKILLQGSTCTLSCSQGYAADSYYICQPTAVPGADVQCGNAGNGGTPADCNGCGTTKPITDLFSTASGGQCHVADCTADPGSNLSGWMCKSCNGANSAHSAYSAGKFLKGSACIASCGTGFTADSNQICQPNTVPGADVDCGTPSTSSSINCNNCGANLTVQNLFTTSFSPNCKVTDCKVDPGSNLNGWMCKSCNGANNAHAAYSAGKFLQGNACVSSCNNGFTADSNQICQPNTVPGADVGCGTASTGNSSNCNNCGANSSVQNLFTPSTSPNCKVTDCKVDPGSNLNGWMCKSCNGANNAHTAYSAGKFLQGNACVSSCNNGFTADSNQICQPNTVPGADVSCGTSSTGNSSNCNNCGSNSTVQSLFTPSTSPNCKVTDCKADPGSNLNGWMCKSCNGANNAHAAYSYGKFLQGIACASSCNNGFTADINNICQANSNTNSNANTQASSGSFLTLGFSMLLLYLSF